MRITFPLLCAGLVAAAHAEGPVDCSAIPSDDERLECYDVAAARDAPAAAAAAAVKAAPAAAVQATPAAAPVPEQTFGKSAEDITAIIAEAAGVEDVDEISGSVISVTRDARGRFVLLLDSQQRWRQIGAERFKIKAGDEIVIRRAALSSFALQRRSGGRKVKVRRID